MTAEENQRYDVGGFVWGLVFVVAYFLKFFDRLGFTGTVGIIAVIAATVSLGVLLWFCINHKILLPVRALGAFQIIMIMTAVKNVIDTFLILFFRATKSKYFINRKYRSRIYSYRIRIRFVDWLCIYFTISILFDVFFSKVGKSAE